MEKNQNGTIMTDSVIQDMLLILFYYLLFHDIVIIDFDIIFRFTLPPHLTLKNFEDLDLGKMDKVQIVIFHSEINLIILG